MKKNILSIILILLVKIVVAQKVSLDIEQLLFLGKVPQKNPTNILVDKLDYILSFDIPKDSTVRIGYLDNNGSIKIKPVYSMGLDFYDDYANVIKDSLYGYIDKNGKARLFNQYNKVYFYYGDTGIAIKEKKSALIKRDGTPITDFIYSRIDIYGYKYFKANINKEESYILNEKGNRIFKITSNIKSHFIADSIVVYQDTINGELKQGLLDINESVILKIRYDKLSGYFDENDLMLVTNKGKQGYIDKSGKIIIPIIYDKIKYNFTEGLTPVLKDHKWGFIDKNNKTIVPFIYDDAHGFSEGLAFVKKGNYYGYINKNNKVKIPFKFENTRHAFFIKGLSLYRENKKFGYINKKGKIKIKAIYDSALPFYNEKAHVRLNNKEGFIDKNGKEIIPIKYKQLWMESSGMIRFVE